MCGIPAKFVEVIRAFLVAKKTGKLILNVKDGTVLVVDITESVRL